MDYMRWGTMAPKGLDVDETALLQAELDYFQIPMNNLMAKVKVSNHSFIVQFVMIEVG